MQRPIATLLGIRIDQLICTYLGIPLFQGVIKLILWCKFIGKYMWRAKSWKGCCLSLIRRLNMVKPIIAAILIYMLSYMELVSKIEKELIGIQCKFLWEGSNEINKSP